MATPSKFTRPMFGDALKAWNEVLSQRGLPTDLIWVFGENLVFEKDPAGPGGFQLRFQTRFTPPPHDAEGIAYGHFCETEAPIVFYRAGSSGGKSVCALLCDSWFESKGEKDGFIRRDEWRIAFRPGGAEELEEITDKSRWQQRVLRGRPLHHLDFCMTLQSVHETLAHGRVLSAYEHYALKLLHVWRRLTHGGE
jgi:hypothetical protein